MANDSPAPQQNEGVTPHPIQPLLRDQHGVWRFKENAIVRFLLDNGPLDLNRLAVMPFSNDDRRQFAQLIGYSLVGFGELSYVDDDTYERAHEMAKTGNSEHQEAMRAMVLQRRLDQVRNSLRGPIAELYGIHPDDLMEAQNDG